MAKSRTHPRRFKSPTKVDYRSDLERRVAKQLRDAAIPYTYEGVVLPYIMGGKVHSFTPDFKVGPSAFIECKGRFVDEVRDSRKLILVQQQHPEIELRLVFQRENQKLSREDTTTFAQWAEAHGFTWAGGGAIPQDWVHEFRGKLH